MWSDNIIRIVQTVLATAVAAFAISVVVSGHWPETPPPPPPTVDARALKSQVVSLVRNHWNTREYLREYGVTIDDDLMLINTDINKYNGLVGARTRIGTEMYLKPDVLADPSGSMF